MAKKGTKIALTYFITIMVTLIIIGGICFMLFRQLTAPKETDVNIPDISGLMSEEYVPTAENNKTALFIFDSEKRMSGCCFMLVRLIADERRMAIMPLPADTCANTGGTEDGLYEFYRRGGAPQAVLAAENAVGLTIDYYMKLNNDSFGVIVDIFGGVDFDVPYNLIYSNPDTGEETIIREGNVYLDSDLLRKVVTYPLFNSGEEYRAKITGVLINDLINKNIDEGFSNHIDDYFSAVINSTAETNFTAYDYEAQSRAMKYVASSDDRVCQLVTVTGAYNDNGNFVLDENFLKSVAERFKLYEPESVETETSLMAVE